MVSPTQRRNVTAVEICSQISHVRAKPHGVMVIQSGCWSFTFSEDELISSSKAHYACIIRIPWKWHVKMKPPVPAGSSTQAPTGFCPQNLVLTHLLGQLHHKQLSYKASQVWIRSSGVQDEHAASPNRGGKIQLLGANYKVESHSKVSMGSLSLRFL